MNRSPDKCPRCEAAGPETLCHAPVEDTWTIFLCPTCFFTWRSSEPDFITDPEKYPSRFKFAPTDMANFGIMPNIPELKRH
ncbi:TPA: phenolic acid decarboxylase subunit D [Serratia marcescens]|nr:phenolic acid decarboxylase subunit D [Serratia marcescens]